ncbi:MAG: hypothetical protein IPN69_18550 [Acidobacteria bacterium]|nr:hypothetical protein [Acidobacteriota bacterium]
MSKRKVLTAIIVLLLIGVPILINRWISESARRQDARDDELVAKYECEPPTKCVADFNGDGIADRLDVIQTDPANRSERWLVALSDERELLRLPYDHTDNTLRTHTAVVNDVGKSSLLVYDGASYRPALKAAFVWKGEKMVEVTPSSQEREILSAMAAHDDTGGWNDRVLRDLYEVARLIAYYVLLAIVAGVIAYRKYGKRVAVKSAI